MALTTLDPNTVSGPLTLSNGNLSCSVLDQSNWGSVRATNGKSAGKWYWEITIINHDQRWKSIGVATLGAQLGAYFGYDIYGWVYYCNGFGGPGYGKLHAGNAYAYGSYAYPGYVVGVALDMDNGLLTFYLNGVSMGVAWTGVTGTVFPAISMISGDISEGCTFNFGATAFSYTPPYGYLPYNGTAPGAFALASPANASTDRGISGTLRWDAADNADNYDVYLDTHNPPTTLVSTNQTDLSYYYDGLDLDTVYYWKVVAKNSIGNTTCTSIFHFTTIVPAAPGKFSLYFPTNGAKNQPLVGTLTWGECLNASAYDVYLDKNNPPTTRVSTDQEALFYDYGTTTPLDVNTIYHWKVVAKGSGGSQNCNSIFSFTTYAVAPGTGVIVAFGEQSGSYRPYSYLSKRFTYRKTVFTCGRVLAATYPVYLDIIFPDPFTFSITVADDQPFRIPAWLAEELELRISGIGAIYAVFLAGALEELPV
jgi:SPRY domain